MTTEVDFGTSEFVNERMLLVHGEPSIGPRLRYHSDLGELAGALQDQLISKLKECRCA